MEKDKRVMQEIKEYIKTKLMKEFGHCGVSENSSKNFIMLNSGENNLIIQMKIV